MGNVFSSIGVYDRQKSASMAFTKFGTAHKYANMISVSCSSTCTCMCSASCFRQMADEGDKLVKRAAPVSEPTVYNFWHKPN